jgi:hypothetical protein
MDEFNERSRADIAVAFTDPAGAPVVPATITYSTKCRTTGTPIKADIPVTPAASVTITLDSADQAIQNSANPYELKVLTIKSTYGVGDECNDEYVYRVKNLSGV